MAVLAVTYTLANGQTSDATLWNTNYSDIVTWLNNRYNGSDTWSFLKVSSSDPNPVDVSGSGSSTELSINNSATDGDPILTFKLGGSQTHVIGVDDSDSDFLKFATTAITTNVAFQIPASGVQVQFANGSNSVPSISFINSPTTGFYRAGSNQIGIAMNGNLFWTLDSGGSLSGQATGAKIFVDNGSAGAPSFSFFNGTTSGFFWAATEVGVTFAGNEIMSWRAAQIVTQLDLNPSGAGSINLGNGTNYYNDVSYKTLTDRGCLPWCDEGVELLDGSVVSDLDALGLIQKSQTEKTVHDVPKLDYKTFPKKAYVKVTDHEGNLLPRDENDLPVGGADGIEMTFMFGVMIGAFKEIKERLEKLETKLA